MTTAHYRKTYCTPQCAKRATRNRARTQSRATYTQHFIGVDGEGINLPDGEHRYVMLSVGNETLWKNGEPLTHLDILPFLYGHILDNPDEKCAYVGFYLGYDFTQWFKHLTEPQARKLFTPAGIAARRPKSARIRPFPVYLGSKWEVDMLAMKRLRFRPHVHSGKGELCGCGYRSNKLPDKNPNVWGYLCDVGPFFQTSFINVLDPKAWSGEAPCTPDEYAMILDGKMSRANKVTLDDLSWLEPMKEYNRLENRLLASVMEIYSGGFKDLGIRLDKTCYYGPGQAAQKWLNSQPGFIKREDIAERIPGDMLDVWRKTYYGGRFEIFYHGNVKGTQYEYDIQSAYPDSIRRLPCLCTVSWERKNVENARDHSLTIVYGRFAANNRSVSALPVRLQNGSIVYPSQSEGWYRLHEIVAGTALIDWTQSEIIEVWNPVGECDHEPPLAALGSLFDLRLRVGKSTPQGKALKLIYNSCYGKMAQSVGSPKYANPIYASIITSDCRIRLLGAITSHPDGLDSLLMCATDGIYFQSEHPGMPPVDGNIQGLGLWEATVKQNLTLMKPGVYWDDKARQLIDTGKDAKLKSRGISARALQKHLREIEGMFDDWSTTDNPPPAFTMATPFSIVSPRLALARNKWGTAGRVEYDVSRTEIAACQPKRRRWGTVYPGLVKSATRTLENPVTYPYEKMFGMDEQLALAELYTQDGEKAIEDNINAYIELRNG